MMQQARSVVARLRKGSGETLAKQDVVGVSGRGVTSAVVHTVLCATWLKQQDESLFHPALSSNIDCKVEKRNGGGIHLRWEGPSRSVSSSLTTARDGDGNQRGRALFGSPSDLTRMTGRGGQGRGRRRGVRK